MRRILVNLLLLFYLAITASAILFTLTRIRVPFLPWFFIRWSYNAMAPYQGDTDFHIGIALFLAIWWFLVLIPACILFLEPEEAKRCCEWLLRRSLKTVGRRPLSL